MTIICLVQTNKLPICCVVGEMSLRDILCSCLNSKTLCIVCNNIIGQSCMVLGNHHQITKSHTERLADQLFFVKKSNCFLHTDILYD